MKAVMLDLETMALSSHAAVVSIGAVEFNPELATSEPYSGLGREFYVPVSLNKQVSKWGREVESSTLEWWKGQPAEVRAALTDSRSVFLDDALHKFAEWLGGRNLDVWGNGAAFDNVVLANAYRATGSPVPWGFRNDRCYRTLKALGEGLGIAYKEPQRLVQHNALDDAKYQAEIAVQILRGMKR